MNIAWLLERMAQRGQDRAMVWRDQECTYLYLLERVTFWQHTLKEQGIAPQTVVTIEGDFSPNTCSLLLALIAQDAILVPLTAAERARREEFLTTAEVQAIFSFDDEDRWQLEQRNVTVANPITRNLLALHDPGLVLFSSGSTGKPKAALHNFSKLLEKFKVERNRMCTLVFLLFDHIGGLNTLFYTLSNGGSMVVTRERSAEEVCRLIERYQVELLPTSPTFLRLLLISEAYRAHDLSSLKLITYGTEVMPENTLKRLNQVFPNVRFQQTYGLSELGIMRSKSRDSGSLWVKIGGEGFETKIVDGILWLKAESAMMGYLNAPSPFTDDGWFITGDVVQVEGEYLRILGRASEIINVGGEKVFPGDVESVLQAMDGVEEVIVNAESNPITGQIVKAQVKLSTTETVAQFRKRMHAFCRAKLTVNQIPQKVVLVNRDMHSERFKKIRRGT